MTIYIQKAVFISVFVIIAVALLLFLFWSSGDNDLQAQGGGPEFFQFAPYANTVAYSEPSFTARITRDLSAGQVILLHAPYVGNEAHWWLSTNAAHSEWVAVFVNGFCPRERLGEVIGYSGG